MKTVLKALVALIAFSGIGAGLYWSHLKNKEEKPKESDKPESRLSEKDDEVIIKLEPDLQTKSGIVAEPLQAAAHQPEIRAYAQVLEIQDLVEARSNLCAAQSQLDKASAALEFSRKDYDRVKKLHDEDRAVSDKVLEASEGAKKQDEAGERAARQALEALKIGICQKCGVGLAGCLLEGKADGLIEQKEVLMQVTLPSGTRLVSPPPTGSAVSPDGSLTPIKFLSNSPRTDPRLQGMSYYYTAPAGTLLPGMSLQALLPAGEAGSGFTVLQASVVWWQGKAWVYVQKDADHFIRREIPTDAPVKSGWFVSEKFTDKDKLVVSGAQLILSEEFRSQIKGEE